MASIIQQLKGTAAEVAAKTYAVGVLVWNETAKRWHGGDGVTAGGIAMARYDERNDGSLGYEQRVETAASNSVTVADIGKAIVGNRATAIAFNLDPAASLTSKFTALFKNIGAGAMTIVPNGTQLIDGVNAAITVPSGSSVIVKGDGTSFRTFLANGDVTGSAINNAAALTGANLDDNDKLGVYDTSATALAGVTITEFVAGIFKTARKIANAYFLSSFRLWDATDPTKGLAFDLAAIAAATTRTATMPNRDVLLGAPVLHVRDLKATNTQGGTSSTGVQVRALNTVVVNEIAGASLASNVITLPAGVYDVEGAAPAFNSIRHKAWLRVSGGGATVLDGLSSFAQTMQTHSLINGRLTVASTSTYEVAHFFESGVATNGLGVATNAPSQPEVYTDLIFRKIG